MTTQHKKTKTIIGLLGAAALTTAIAGAAFSSPSEARPAPADAGVTAHTTVHSTSYAAKTSSAGASRASASRSSADQEGPVVKATSTGDDIARMEVPYRDCLQAQGVPTGSVKEFSKFSMGVQERAHYKAEFAACVSYLPESLGQRYEREHPDTYQAHLQQFISCMNDHNQGIIFIAPDAWGVTDEDAPTTVLSNAVIDTCQTAAFTS